MNPEDINALMQANLSKMLAHLSKRFGEEATGLPNIESMSEARLLLAKLALVTGKSAQDIAEEFFQTNPEHRPANK